MSVAVREDKQKLKLNNTTTAHVLNWSSHCSTPPEPPPETSCVVSTCVYSAVTRSFANYCARPSSDILFLAAMHIRLVPYVTVIMCYDHSLSCISARSAFSLYERASTSRHFDVSPGPFAHSNRPFASSLYVSPPSVHVEYSRLRKDVFPRKNTCNIV